MRVSSSVRLASSSVSVARYQSNVKCAACIHQNQIQSPLLDSILFSSYGVWCVILALNCVHNRYACSAVSTSRHTATLFCWSGKPFVFVYEVCGTHRFHHCKGFISITFIVIMSFRFHFRCPWCVAPTFALSTFRSLIVHLIFFLFYHFELASLRVRTQKKINETLNWMYSFRFVICETGIRGGNIIIIELLCKWKENIAGKIKKKQQQ